MVAGVPFEEQYFDNYVALNETSCCEGYVRANDSPITAPSFNGYRLQVEF